MGNRKVIINAFGDYDGTPMLNRRVRFWSEGRRYEGVIYTLIGSDCKFSGSSCGESVEKAISIEKIHTLEVLDETDSEPTSLNPCGLDSRE